MCSEITVEVDVSNTVMPVALGEEQNKHVLRFGKKEGISTTTPINDNVKDDVVKDELKELDDSLSAN